MDSTQAVEFLKFVNASPSPYHAVHETQARLELAGYTRIHEDQPWRIEPLGKYYFTRNQSSIVAFHVGGKFVAGNGFSIVAAHTDSPVLKIKPVSKTGRHGYVQVGVECYGGGLWHTWFDRDLTLAGRVLYESNGHVKTALIHPHSPVMRIPTLAIHLDRGVNDEGFKFNKQTHLLPVLSTVVADALNQPATGTMETHHSALIGLLAREAECQPDEIRDFEVNLVDNVPGAIGGLNNEFIFSGRLDNLMMSFCAVQGLLASTNIESEHNVRMIALFDNEEVGSGSNQGAAGTMMQDVITRITQVTAGENAPRDLEQVAFRRSLLVSADMAHAIHPNYPEKHEENHQPRIHAGVVVKTNSNQRYATNAQTALAFRRIAAAHDIPLQEFVVRNDVMCGSTIGPIIAANCGLRTVDIGVPQLSMHSIREMCGVTDVAHGVSLCTHFLNDFSAVDANAQFD